MISVKELIDSVDFEPEIVYLSDDGRAIKVNYASLKEEFGYNLDSFLELVPMTGHVYYSEHLWKDEIDLYCNTSLLELLKQIDEEQNGMYDQKPAKYLLMVQRALEDLHFGDVEGIAELTSLLETSTAE